MTDKGPAVDDLRAVLSGGADGDPVPGPDCPAVSRIWDALHGDLSGGELREIVDHTSRCAACAETWKVAHALGAMAPGGAPRATWLTRGGLVAAAAAVLVALGLVASLPTFRPPAAPVFREGRVVEIRSLVPEHRPVPRSDLVLRWTSDPDGAAFTVRVSTSDFRPVFVAEGLDRTECRVPEEALAGIPAGARLLWQVEAVAPDGRRSASPTFFVVVE